MFKQVKVFTFAKKTKTMLSFLEQQDIHNLIAGRTSMALSRAFNAGFRKNGIPISKEQFSILVILWKKDGFSQQYLAEHTFRDKPGITRLIDTLEREELVFRKADPHDRRSNLIFLTQKGRDLEAEVTASVKETLAIAAKGLTEEDARNLKRILDMVYENIK